MACERSDGTHSDIVTFAKEVGFGSWTPLFTYSDDRSLYNPAAVLDDTGSEVVIGWIVDSDPFDYLNATVYTNGAWSPVTQISFGANDAYNLRLDTNNYGEAVALWSENDGTNYFVCASVFSSGSWMGAQYVTEGDLDMVEGPVRMVLMRNEFPPRLHCPKFPPGLLPSVWSSGNERLITRAQHHLGRDPLSSC